MQKKTLRYIRLGVLVVLGGVLYLIGSQPAVQAFFEPDHLRQLTADAGAWGMLTYLGIFLGGSLLQIPAVVFVVLGLVAFDPISGGLLAYLGSLVATSLNYWMVRSIGGTPLADVQNSWARRLLDQLDDRPLRTLVLIRLFFYMNPVVNYPLALSGLSFRSYIIGSAIGFITPIVVLALSLDFVLSYFGFV